MVLSNLRYLNVKGIVGPAGSRSLEQAGVRPTRACLFFLRWQGPKTTPLLPADYPAGTVVNLSGLGAVLPADTPMVTPIQRAFALFVRGYGLARRIVLSSNDAVAVLQPALRSIQDAVGAAAFSSIYHTVVLSSP